MKKIIKTTKEAGKGLLAAALSLVMLLGVYNIIIPDSIDLMSGEALPVYAGTTAETDGAAEVYSGRDTASVATYTAEYRFLGVLPIKNVRVNLEKRTELYVGGIPFGVRFSTDGVMVVGYGSEREKIANPGYSAGIKPADVIKKIDGKIINDIGGLTDALENCGGKAMTFTCERAGKEYTVNITPYKSGEDGKYKTGLLVRDSGAGIGTVTYIEPETGFFGGLGHGICDGETGAVVPMRRGTVSDVTVSGAIKGMPGSPGELKGSFKANKTGALLNNTSLGVFGMFSKIPENHGELLPIAAKSEVKCGEAYIMCTLDESGPQRYSIKINEINKDANGSKCFTVKITDRKLIEKTGGIVQGMSGSPIIQNGKLVGAVTHVLINDPTTGYGIFIENMLNAADLPMERAA